MTESADPAADAGRQLRAATIQAVQTALMYSQYQRGLNMERRAATEHADRQARAKASEFREGEIHDLKVQGYLDRAQQAAGKYELERKEVLARMARGDADLERRDRAAAAAEERDTEIHELKKQGYLDRTANTAELHDLDKQDRLARIARGDADLARRDRLAATGEEREIEIHDLKKAGYDSREQRATELHRLDQQERLQRMAIRARAAGLSEELAKTGAHTDHLAATIAGFAAATATADLGPDQQRAADAFGERSRAAGLDPDDILGAARDEPQHSSQPTTASTDADTGTDPLAERIEDLVAAAFDAADQATGTAATSSPDPGTQIADTVARAGLGNPHPTPGQSVSMAPPVTTTAAPAPHQTIEEGLEL